jgi:hypothetical protein
MQDGTAFSYYHYLLSQFVLLPLIIPVLEMPFLYSGEDSNLVQTTVMKFRRQAK